MRVEWLKEVLPDPEDQREYAREHTAIVLTEAVGEAMEEANLNRLALASKLGRHKSYVTRALSAHQNITLKTLSDLLWACGMEIASVEIAPIGEALLPRDEADNFVIEAVTRPMPASSVPWLSTEGTTTAGSIAEPAVALDASSTFHSTYGKSSEVLATDDSIALAA
jgi:DNA-binding phage protein